MPRLNTQILTATAHLPKEELDRLALSNFRASTLWDDIAKHPIETALSLVDYSKENVDCILDVSEYKFFAHGDYIYVETMFRNLEHLRKAVKEDNLCDAMGSSSGLIESCEEKLTVMHVIHARHLDLVRELTYGLTLNALHESFKF